MERCSESAATINWSRGCLENGPVGRRLGRGRKPIQRQDSLGRRYDLEIQRAGEGADPRRARYHGAAMDVEALGRGQGFSALPERYVIFVTEGDYFGKGAGAYRFERVDEAAGVALDDGTHVVYANGSYRGRDALGRLMHDFSCSDPDDMHDGPMADRARYLKQTAEGVDSMNKVIEDMKEEYMQKGMREGMRKGMLEALGGLVRDGVLTLPAAAERAGMTPEQFSERAAADGLALGK